MTSTDLRDLFLSSHGRFSTVLVDSSYSNVRELTTRAMRRFAKGENARVVESGTAGARSQAHVVHESHIWWRQPNCWREDRHGFAGASVSIACGGVSSDYEASRRTLHTTREPDALKDRLESFLKKRPHRLSTISERVSAMPLLTPSWVSPDWDFHVHGVEMHMEREGVRATARWMGSEAVPILAFIDTYNILVDVERGILLACSGLVDNQPAIVYSASAVQFDVDIPPEIFSFEPPLGTRTIWCTGYSA